MLFKNFPIRALTGNDVNCKYVVRGNSVHAKVYIWLKDDTPIVAFSGSANYTNTGFGKTQVEAMSEVDPSMVSGFYYECLRNSESCDALKIETMIAITETRAFNDNPLAKPDGDFITLTLLSTKDGETHQKAGLNWRTVYCPY